MKKINGLRFIIGTACNYDCFYCHHEGCYSESCNSDLIDYENKIKLLYEFCIKNEIYEIAITGGEPFLYFDKLSILFKYFSNSKFHVIVNTNASLIHKYADFINNLPCKLEFHVNLSSLKPMVHKEITRTKLFYDEIKSLKMIDTTKHIIKLNIICLKSLNDNELIELNTFATTNNYIPRYLVFYDSNNTYSNLIMSVDDICNVFGARVYKRFSYGIYLAKGDANIEIIKCLCADRECEICKLNTYLHIDPELNIKYCLNLNETVKINYKDINSASKAFANACIKLEEIV